MSAIFRFLTFIVTWWYCYDDNLTAWLISIGVDTGKLDLGNIPFFVWLVVWLALGAASAATRRKE